MTPEQRELYLYCANNPRQVARTERSFATLEKRVRDETFNRNLAIRFMTDNVKSAAKDYAAEYSSGRDTWREIFTMSDCDIVATTLVEDMDRAISSGNTFLR